MSEEQLNFIEIQKKFISDLKKVISWGGVIASSIIILLWTYNFNTQNKIVENQRMSEYRIGTLEKQTAKIELHQAERELKVDNIISETYGTLNKIQIDIATIKNHQAEADKHK